MATLVLTNAYVWVGGVDLSSKVTQVMLNYGSETVDASAMGLATRIKKGSVLTWDLSLTFQQDYAAGSVYQTLKPLVGTTACFEVRPTNACSTQANPSFYGVATPTAFPPLGGQFGALVMADAKFEASSALNTASSS